MEISSFMNILLWYDTRVAYHRAILTVSKVVTYCVPSGELIPFSEPAFFKSIKSWKLMPGFPMRFCEIQNQSVKYNWNQFAKHFLVTVPMLGI